ncbi:MAG: chromosomal replication initiator protein DnaA [Deltaproteobacteria bacterium]|nr:MAG: chromosomal replication initiator protein DnaA [Deltaproteobacteria bacterium]
MEAVWEQVKAKLKKKLSSQAYHLWIDPVCFDRIDNGRMVLNCVNSFSKKRIHENYHDLIASEMDQLTGQRCEFSFEVKSSPTRSRTPAARRKQKPVQLGLPNMNVQVHSGRYLRRDFTFDQFVVGGNSDFAFSASLSFASCKNKQQNALLLMSKTGMGKSHLSQAIGHHVLSEFPNDRVYYITAEDFTNELVSAFRHGSVDRFKSKYRNGCDVLILEDIHYLSGRNRTQIELAHMLDTMYESGKTVIFSSCYLPGDIPKLTPELRSRLQSGLISDIEPPDFNTRVRILKKKAKARRAGVSMDILRYLATELTEDVRQLESGLTGVMTRSSLMSEPVNMALAENVVKIIGRRRKKITIDVIKKLVAREYDLTVAELVSKSRRQQIVKPRQIAMYLSRVHTDSPLQTIGQRFNRYHATVIHAVGAVENAMRKETTIKRQVEMLKKKIEAGNV